MVMAQLPVTLDEVHVATRWGELGWASLQEAGSLKAYFDLVTSAVSAAGVITPHLFMQT